MTPIRLHNTLLLLGAIVLLSLALMRGISSDLHVPAAEILVAECQGFEALATTGGKRLRCDADVAVLNDAREPGAAAPPSTVREQPSVPSASSAVPATVPPKA